MAVAEDDVSARRGEVDETGVKNGLEEGGDVKLMSFTLELPEIFESIREVHWPCGEKRA